MNEHVESLDYFNGEQKSELLQALKSYPTLFGGGLGKLNIEPIRLELKEGAKPYHAKPFGISHAYETTTRKEIERFEKTWNLEASWPLLMERRHIHPTEQNGRCARTYRLSQTQRVFSPQAAPTTKNQRALTKAPRIQMGNSY